MYTCRLGGRVYRRELRERGLEVKQLKREQTLSDGLAKWQALLAGQRLLHVQRLARVLVPHVAQLVTDAEAHPGFIKAMPDGEQLLSELLERNPLIAPDPQASSLPHPFHPLFVIRAVFLAWRLL